MTTGEHMTTLWLYARLMGLLFVLTLLISGHFAIWGLDRHPVPPRLYAPNGSADRGRERLIEYGCGACHVIPGIQQATGLVGPPLDRLRDQIYIGGVLYQSPQNLARWISDPKTVDPRTAMPDLGVSPEEAQDMAAYLYAVESP